MNPAIPHARGRLTDARPALAVVLGRAGSKGVPGKNMMPIAGRPCAAWTIEHALAAEAVGAVIVSTDDPRLAELAHEMGVQAVPRSPGLATDKATVDAAAREAVTTWEGPTELTPLTPIVILYANVPVRPSGLIDKAVRLMRSCVCDSVQSYAPVGKYHPWWTARTDGEGGVIRPWEGEVLNHGVYRRQDLPPAYIPDGGVLVVARHALFSPFRSGPHDFLGAVRHGVFNGEGDVVDIDSRIDSIVADTILREQQTETRGPA